MGEILEREFHDALLRKHLELFVQRSVMTLNQGRPYLANWHISTICFALEQVYTGKIKRLIINVPPRHLKSIITSVAFPAWMLGHEPHRRIVCLSYAHELAAKHAADCRAVVQSDWYWRAFPRTRISRTANDEVFTTAGGFRKTVSMFGTVTGFGGDMLIIDDPQKPIEAQSELQRNQVNQWFSNTLLSRLTYKEDAAIVVVMQRLHLEHVPFALNHAVSAQGGMIKRSWLRYYGRIPDEALKRGKIIESWDTASKEGALNDWSVCTTWLYHDRQYYLIDLTRGRYDYPKLRARAVALAEKYKPRYILIEDAAIGTALAQELKHMRFGSATKLIKPIGDKLSRLYVNEVKFETGCVHFPQNAPSWQSSKRNC